MVPSAGLASVSDAGGAVTSYLYDSEGRRSAEINPLGLTNTFAYDGQDNLLASTNEIGAATSATYDEFGQVLTSVDARGAGTTNEYDANGNLIKTLYGASGVQLFLGSGPPRLADAAEFEITGFVPAYVGVSCEAHHCHKT